MVKIAPSILAADFANLAADIARVVDEVELLHVDCMDGHYVPNLTIGPPVVAALRPHTDLFLDCHLMVDNPSRLMSAFADAGADGISVHVELGDTAALLAQIAALGLRRGLAFEPETPYDAVEPFLTDIDVLLVMSVHTGYGGQPFIPGRARQGPCRPHRHRHGAASPSKSRSTAASSPPTRDKPAPPVSTFSCRGPASSAPTIR